MCFLVITCINIENKCCYLLLHKNNSNSTPNKTMFWHYTAIARETRCGQRDRNYGLESRISFRYATKNYFNQEELVYVSKLGSPAFCVQSVTDCRIWYVTAYKRESVSLPTGHTLYFAKCKIQLAEKHVEWTFYFGFYIQSFSLTECIVIVGVRKTGVVCVCVCVCVSVCLCAPV